MLRRLEYRGALPDQDCVEVELVAGENPLMVKVDQETGGWAFYLRLTDPEGMPLRVDAGW